MVLETLGDLFSPALRWCACGDTLGLVVWRLFGFADRGGAPRCEACSRPYSGSLESFVCSNCRGKAFHFRHAVAVMQSRGVV